MFDAFFESLSVTTGISDDSLRLLSALLGAYPLALVYNVALARRHVSPFIRNLYNLASSIFLFCVFSAQEIHHPLITTAGTYILCKISRRHAAKTCFVWNFGYLFIGYLQYATTEYDINWTTPASVLCLRLIGFGMDYSSHVPDPKTPPGSRTTQESEQGANKENSVGNVVNHAETQAVARKRRARLPLPWQHAGPVSGLPDPVEFLAFSMYYGALMVGPVFPYNHYQLFVQGKLFETTAKDKRSNFDGMWRHVLSSVVTGLCILGTVTIVQGYYPISYVLTEEFAGTPFHYRVYYSFIAAKAVMTQYLGVWKVAEGACALSSISYNGPRKWDGLQNIDLWRYEAATNLSQIVESFNKNTNQWAKTYIYKPIMAATNGKRLIASLSTLNFLALWHGYHPGYLLTFFTEYIDVEAERRWRKWLGFTEQDGLVRLALGWIWSQFQLYYAVVGFTMLTWEKYQKCFAPLYWWGHILSLSILGVTSILEIALRPRRKGKTA